MKNLDCHRDLITSLKYMYKCNETKTLFAYFSSSGMSTFAAELLFQGFVTKSPPSFIGFFRPSRSLLDF